MLDVSSTDSHGQGDSQISRKTAPIGNSSGHHCRANGPNHQSFLYCKQAQQVSQKFQTSWVSSWCSWCSLWLRILAHDQESPDEALVRLDLYVSEPLPLAWRVVALPLALRAS